MKPKLTKAQREALRILEHTTPQCACLTSNDREGVTLRMAQALAHKGYVEISPRPRHSRAWITDAGRAALKDGAK